MERPQVGPFATSVTLTALANILDNYEQSVVSRKDYFDILKTYTRSQHLRLDDGSVVPWIDEDLNPTNGDWIARALLKQRGSEIPERGKDYNHSTYCDLVISGLVGLRPRADGIVEINPLAPSAWDYFCLDKPGPLSRSLADDSVGQDRQTLPPGQGTTRAGGREVDRPRRFDKTVDGRASSQSGNSTIIFSG